MKTRNWTIFIITIVLTSLICQNPIFIKNIKFFQVDSRRENLIDMAAMEGLPIVWFKIGQNYAIVIEGHVFTQKNEFESFFMYFTSFSIFCVQWDSMRNMDGSTKAIGFPNRGALELIHWYILWHYRLWSFKTRDTKLERFLHKNQHTQRKIIEFGELD